MNVKFLGTCILTASLLFSAAAQAQSAPDYASIIEQGSIRNIRVTTTVKSPTISRPGEL